MNILLSPNAAKPQPGWALPPLPHPPQQAAAPIVLPADGEQRSLEISRASGVSHFLDIYDDVVAVADCLKTIMDWHGDDLPAGGQPRFRERIPSQEEVREIAADITDICNELIPGALAARDYHFTAYLEAFDPPPLPDGSDQTKQVSQRLTPVPPEWMSSRQK